MSIIQAPTLLNAEHQVSAFDCGEFVMDDWLKRRALANQASGASRTFVVANTANIVSGYYALAAGAVDHATAGSAMRRNMPNPVPVMVLGRFAVERGFRGNGLGADLLADAISRTNRLAQEVGIRALIVHALHDRASAFYRNLRRKTSNFRPVMKGVGFAAVPWNGALH